MTISGVVLSRHRIFPVRLILWPLVPNIQVDAGICFIPQGARKMGGKDYPAIAPTSGRSEHHRKLNILISAEIKEHKLAGHTLLLA
jgi:hypothetical protein